MGVKRNQYLDLVKGVAIWLVAFGHCLQTFVPNWTENRISLAIVSFHMPLFMAVSGYFFYPSVAKSSLTEFVKKKFLHLYLPSLCWGVFSLAVIGGG